MNKKKPINVEIGMRVQQAREAAGLTQERFAELIGLGVKHVSAIECGSVGVSLNTLRKTCTALSIPADLLLFGETEGRDISEPVKPELLLLMDRFNRLPAKKFEVAKDILDNVLIALTME